MSGKLRFDDENESPGIDDESPKRKQRRKRKQFAENKQNADVKLSHENELSTVNATIQHSENSTVVIPNTNIENNDGIMSNLEDENAAKKIGSLEKKSEKYGKQLDRVQSKLPTKKVKKKTRVFNDDKPKNKLTFEEEALPVNQTKWNLPQHRSLPRKAVGSATSFTISKAHVKVYQVEHENVGTQTAHRAELLGESAYRGAKRSAISAYRFHKNRPFRKAAKLQTKKIKTEMKLEYKKILQESGARSHLNNGGGKRKPLSRFYQKRAIKRKYAARFKGAKASGKAAKASVGFTQRLANIATKIIRRNPIFMLKAGLLILIVFIIVSMVSMCSLMFSSNTAFIGLASYTAESSEITGASSAYAQWETDLEWYLYNIELNYPGFDEYRVVIHGEIGHDPFEIIAFLTAMFEDFRLVDVESILREVFYLHYNVEIVQEVETRQRIEIRTGIDEDGNFYTHAVTVEYDWSILNVTVTVTPFRDVIQTFLSEDQKLHFEILMESLGARQLVGTPFLRDWTQNIRSGFGYRMHPIHREPRHHNGIDIAWGGISGYPIMAGVDGYVVRREYHPNGWGHFVEIQCEAGVIRVLYAHLLARSPVAVGARVHRGDIIGQVGSSGASTGPHLHLEVRLDGQLIDPTFFVDTVRFD